MFLAIHFKNNFLSHTSLYLHTLLLNCLLGFSQHTSYREERLRAAQISTFIDKSQKQYKSSNLAFLTSPYYTG